MNLSQASAGRNAFQLSNGALYSERDCSGATFDRGDVTDVIDDLTTSKGVFKPKAKPQVMGSNRSIFLLGAKIVH